MTTALLRVPRQPEQAAQAWMPLYGPPAAFIGSDICTNSVYYNGKTYFGFIDQDGNVRVASYTHATGAVAVSPAVVSGLTADAHTTPSVLVRSSDHKILLAVAPHNTAHMYVAVSSSAEDVSAWGAASDIAATLGITNCTYANLFQLSGESGKIYLFYRDFQSGTTNVLAYSTSTDGGSTWAAQTSLYKNTGKQAYWVIASDDTARIDFCVDDGTASNGDTASAYHFYYTGGSFYKTDGTLIGVATPFAPTNLTKIYDGATNGSVRVPYSIVGGASPVIGLAAYDAAGSGQPEKYWYVTYSGSSWSAHLIDTSGSTPSASFSEGGVAVDHLDTTIVYVSRQISAQWQIVKYQTSDGGSTWTSTQLTSDVDQPNLRPIIPRDMNSALRVIWCYGPHWDNSSNGVEPSPAIIRGYPRKVS